MKDFLLPAPSRSSGSCKRIWSGDGADILLPRGQLTIEIALQVSLSANASVDISREQVTFSFARNAVAQHSNIVHRPLMKNPAEDRT